MPNWNNSRTPWFKRNQPKTPENLEPSILNSFSFQGLHGFKLYFYDEDTTDIAKVLKNAGTFYEFIENNTATFDFPQIEKYKMFTVDYKTITTMDEILIHWVDFKEELVNNTEYCLNCMGLAMHQFIVTKDMEKENVTNVDEVIDKYKVIRARIVNYEPFLQLKDLKVNYYGKLISIKGTVIKASDIKIVAACLAFTCSNCTGTQMVKQMDGVFTYPKNCPTKNCKAQTNFTPLFSSNFTRTDTWQMVKVQELIGNDQYEQGRIPRTLDCELREDLVRSCIPGDDVTITGVVKVQNANNSSYNKQQQSSVFSMYLDTIFLVNNKYQSGSTCDRIIFNTKDYYAIQQIHAEPLLFRFLVQSLCPNIYGHEIVKAGLVLALFGGTKTEQASRRTESHVLMVGDPGLGKSQMLQACSNVAPRGVYVCGNTSTVSGLTVTMTREAGGEYSLEAGALMLADQGCCCIDEFDKMPTQHACLLEAMEQQTISIAKAGIVCVFPTRTTILAAANPAGGHYDKSKTIAENLKLSSPMLSRFDLCFILLDRPNRELDTLLSKHVFDMHSGRKLNNLSSRNSLPTTSEVENLRERLMLKQNESLDLLPHELFRKYIAYAQKYVHPKLTDAAKTVLKNYYLFLRKQFQNGDCTPVTPRQLISLIRLTQARAKAELREDATESDALEVVEIMKHSLIDVFTDEAGVLDTTRSQNGCGMSTKNQVMKLLNLLQRKSEAETKSIFTTNEIKELSGQVGISSQKFYGVLQSLNIQGFLLNKGQNRYQLVTAYL